VAPATGLGKASGVPAPKAGRVPTAVVPGAAAGKATKNKRAQSPDTGRKLPLIKSRASPAAGRRHRDPAKAGGRVKKAVAAGYGARAYRVASSKGGGGREGHHRPRVDKELSWDTPGSESNASASPTPARKQRAADTSPRRHRDTGRSDETNPKSERAPPTRSTAKPARRVGARQPPPTTRTTHHARGRNVAKAAPAAGRPPRRAPALQSHDELIDDMDLDAIDDEINRMQAELDD
jgi:hypothetical protein